MPGKSFHLLGEPSSSSQYVELESTLDFQGLQHLIAGQFAIVEPNGMYFVFPPKISRIPTHSIIKALDSKLKTQHSQL